MEVALMRCPHCLEGFHDHWVNASLGWSGASLQEQSSRFGSVYFTVRHTVCPTCERMILMLHQINIHNVVVDERVLWPKNVARAPIPAEVVEPFASDYKEACLVLADSPKASAALSRRCLQRVLREKGKVTPGNLSSEIDQAMKTLPTHLAEAIDGVRNIGNFAAHPNKSTNTGEVIDVEPGEAEWLLETLEGLFDFYLVQPARLASRRAALNQKLADAGQKPMK